MFETDKKGMVINMTDTSIINAPRGAGRMSTRGVAASVSLVAISADLVFGFPRGAGQNAWLGLILSLVMIVPLMCIYARLCSKLPGMSLFDMLEKLFGRVIGRVLSAALAIYAIAVGGFVLCGFGAFIHQTMLVNTPVIFTLVLLMATALYMASRGMAAIGRWSFAVLLGLAATAVFVTFCMIPHMRASNFLPVMENGTGFVWSDATRIYCYRFGEVVVVMMGADFFNVRTDVRKIRSSVFSPRAFVWGGLISYAVIALIFLRCVAVLGGRAFSDTLYPSYRATSIIRLGSFLERIESALIAVYIMSGLAKAAISIVGACKGAAKACGAASYRLFLIPAGIVILAFAAAAYCDQNQLIVLVEQYIKMSLPFHTIIPMAAWIVAEIRFFHRKPLTDDTK